MLKRSQKLVCPFWLAGGQSTPEHLLSAQSTGAVGVQVGTVFALSDESGLLPELRKDLLAELSADSLIVRTILLHHRRDFLSKWQRWKRHSARKSSTTADLASAILVICEFLTNAHRE